MRSVLFEIQLCRRNYQHFFQFTTLLAAILIFVVFYPLTSCAGLKNVGQARVTPIPSRVTTATPGRKLAWSDEFNGPAGTPPDPTKWSPNIGGTGWGNKQLEYDTNNQNAYQDGKGNLVLEARKGNAQGYKCWYSLCQYTSARISTQYHFSFTYGLIEARIKVPFGQGLWPSFWLMGDNFPTVHWPACGEIDIMEYIGRSPNTNHVNVHGPFYVGSGIYILPHGVLSDNFHIFAMLWNPNHLYFMIDGMNYFIISRASFGKNWVFDHPFFLILANAVGGVWPRNPNSTTVFPQKMLISYVRVYTYP